MDDLVLRVAETFEEWPAYKMNNVFLTLQSCMNEVIKCLGDNDYKIQHMNKERLERLGILPRSIRVTDDAARYVYDGTDDEDNDDDNEEV